MTERLRYVERTTGPDDADRRLDRVLRNFLGEIPLSALYRSLRTGRILVNGARAEAGYRLRAGDRIAFDPRLVPPPAPPATASEATGRASAKGLEALGGLLVLATADLLFMNKPRGMLSHGEDSLECRVRTALADRSRSSLSFSPGPLHRLDRNTSGLSVFPRSLRGARAFTSLLRAGRLKKVYLALVEGRVTEEQTWQNRLARDDRLRSSHEDEEGSEARSIVRPLAYNDRYCLLAVEIQTGLTHQIRVQASLRSHPLAGDRKYGGGPFDGGYILHALAIRFPEPPFPDVPPIVQAPLPPAHRVRLAAMFGADKLEKMINSAMEA